MKRKSPIQHLVHYHKRKGRSVQAYVRGDIAVVRSNAGKEHIAIPAIKQKKQDLRDEVSYLEIISDSKRSQYEKAVGLYECGFTDQYGTFNKHGLVVFERLKRKGKLIDWDKVKA